MEQISITRDDFQRAVAKAIGSITKDPDLTDKDPMFILMLSMSGIRTCKTVEGILFDGDSQGV